MMNDSFVHWFRHSSPYITAHRGCTFVISISGESILKQNLTEIVHDIALLHSLGIHLVLVFGARPQIDAGLISANVETEYVNYRRITTIEAMRHILPIVGAIELDLAARFTFNLSNSPMAGSKIHAITGNFVIAKPIGVIAGNDYQHTGEVRRVDVDAIRAQLKHQAIVILPPLGFSSTGEIFNVNAEDVARATAIALHADKLIFLTQKSLLDKHDQLISEMTASAAEALLQQDLTQNRAGRHTLQAGAYACQQGVRRTHIIDCHQNGAVLKELFTREGIGTLITEEPLEHIRPAQIEDVPGILALIEPLEKKGVLLRRSRELLEMEIHYFAVIERDESIIGCGALYPYPNDCMGEIACFAIDQDYRKEKRGDRLMAYFEKQSVQQKITRLLVLTTQSAHWFMERGFQPKALDDVPMARAVLYNYQRNSKILIKTL